MFHYRIEAVYHNLPGGTHRYAWAAVRFTPIKSSEEQKLLSIARKRYPGADTYDVSPIEQSEYNREFK